MLHQHVPQDVRLIKVLPASSSSPLSLCRAQKKAPRQDFLMGPDLWQRNKLPIHAPQGEFLNNHNRKHTFSAGSPPLTPPPAPQHPPPPQKKTLYLFFKEKEEKKCAGPHQPFTKGMSTDVMYLGSDFSFARSLSLSLFSLEKV